MLHELIRIAQVAGDTVSDQQMLILNQMISVAEHAIQWLRNVLMSEAISEMQHCDAVNRQLQVEVAEDDRLHAQQLNATLESNQKQRASETH